MAFVLSFRHDSRNSDLGVWEVLNGKKTGVWDMRTKMESFGKVAMAATIAFFIAPSVNSQESNACPVDGCVVSIASAELDGEELAIVFESNFAPDMSKNHIHVWWGENFTVEQVSNNAETTHGVEQGDWHPTDAFPDYVTTGASSLAARGDAVSLCTSAADRNHDILDTELQNCYSIEALIK